MQPILNRLIYAFPFWVLCASLLSLWHPPLFTWFDGALISIGLAVIMLGMGLTLKANDFRNVVRFPSWVLTGVVLQYTVMPLLGWSLASLYQLPTPFAVGLILVACCPGGTASNVVSYLAEADVALSVTMTSCSTLMAVVMTPALTMLFAGSRVDVPGWGLFWSTVQVVILPVVVGVLLHRLLPKFTEKITPVAPLFAVVSITLIVASIIGAGKEEILKAGARLILAVFSLHAGGFLLGYLFSRWVVRREIPARTISIEVGMQNSGLGVVLARQNFADPLTAIPSAISSLFHSLIASSLAGIWRRTSFRHREGSRASGFAGARHGGLGAIGGGPFRRGE